MNYKGLKIKISIILFIISFIFTVFAITSCSAGGVNSKGMEQPFNNNGRKWRIAYMEGGSYIEYQITLTGIVKGMSEYGWLDDIELPQPEYEGDTASIWEYLSKNDVSKYIEFVEDAYYSSDWDETLRAQNREKLLERLSYKKDIDLVIAMGTWAGLDIANDKHDIPTIVMSTSDPVEAGIIESPERSGFDHVMVRCDPERVRRQLRLFSDIFDFNSLGTVYENNETGRTYSHIEDLEKISEERGFNLVLCDTKDEGLPEDKVIEGALRCIEGITPDIDAFWLGEHRGVSAAALPEVLIPLIEHKIPTWSNLGSDAVKKGVLMSISIQDYDDVGLWHTKNIIEIFNGKKPGDLKQIFEDPKVIAINLKTAEMIGYEPPDSIMGIAEQVYYDIEGME